MAYLGTCLESMFKFANALPQYAKRFSHTFTSGSRVGALPLISTRALSVCPSTRALGASQLNRGIIGYRRNNLRLLYSSLQPTFSDINPLSLIDAEMKDVYNEIIRVLREKITNEEMYDIATSHYVGQEGRCHTVSAMVILFGKALNQHMFNDPTLLDAQIKATAINQIAVTSFNLHDDIFDNVRTRKGYPSSHVVWDPYKVIVVAKLMMSICMSEAAKLGNDVTVIIGRLLEIAYRGQFMPYRGEVPSEKLWGNYLETGDYKSGSVTNYMVKAVAQVARPHDLLMDMIARFGENLGMIGTFVDDILDLEDDIKVGLVTMPVLFAMKEHPVLEEMIQRNFRKDGDVEKTMELVKNSRGYEESRRFVMWYYDLTIRHLRMLVDSPYRELLEEAIKYNVWRMEEGSHEITLVDWYGKKGI